MPVKEGVIFETQNGVITGAENPYTNFRLSSMLRREKAGVWSLEPTLLEAIDGYLQKSVGRSIPEFLRQHLGLDKLEWRFVEANGLLDLAFLGFDKPVEQNADWQSALATIQVNRRDMGADKTIFRESLGIAGVNEQKRIMVAEYNLEPPYNNHDFQLESLAVSVSEAELTSYTEFQWKAYKSGSTLLNIYFFEKLYHLFPSLFTGKMLEEIGGNERARLMTLTRNGSGQMVFFEQISPDEEINQANFFPGQFEIQESPDWVNVWSSNEGTTLSVSVPRYLSQP